MKRTLLQLTILLSIPSLSFAQYRWDVGGSMGASNYLGDIGGKEQTRRDFVADIKFSQTHVALSGFARYKFSQNISAKTSLTYARISGDDRFSTNPGREGRNLSFRNDMFELSAVGEFYFIDVRDVGHAFRYRDDFRAYVFAGVGGLYSNPKAEYNGDWIALQPLETEAVHYNKIQFVLPTGVGVAYTINKNHRIGWELGWRTTFTDYLDDISTVYADPKLLSSTGALLANRNDELPYTNTSDLPDPNNYAPGNKRGDPTHNDSYILSTFSYSYVIQGHSHLWPKYRKITHNHNQQKFGPHRSIRIIL
jgi:hypothetical protein